MLFLLPGSVFSVCSAFLILFFSPKNYHHNHNLRAENESLNIGYPFNYYEDEILSVKDAKLRLNILKLKSLI